MSQIIPTLGQPTPAELEFQQKMMDRLRQSFGDLMPDATLAGIVARGIEDAFFKEKVTKNYYGHETREPSWLADYLRQELQPQVQAAVRKWFAENPDKVAAALDKAFSGGFGDAVLRAFSDQFAHPFDTMKVDIQNVISRVLGDR